MIMRTIITGLLIATISHASHAQTAQRIEIVEYGLYSADVTAKKDDPGSATGDRATVANIRHVETTTTIPARVGIEFGLRYKIYGQPNGATIQLKQVDLIPQPGIRNPNTGNTSVRSEIVTNPKVGEISYIGWHFDNSWELAPGTWVMELWQEHWKLASQSFNVVKP